MLSLTEPTEKDKPETEVDTLELQGDVLEQEQPEQSAQAPEEDIPEKYQGKGLSDIIRMHQEAEKHIGRQGQELGQERKNAQYYQEMLDQMISTKTVDAAPTGESQQDEEIDFFSDPDKAVEARVRKMLEENTDLKGAKQLREEVTRQSTVAQLQKDHPDWQQVAQSPDFAQWVEGSQFRKSLAAQADSYDFGAANELFTLYKERAGYQQAAKTEEQVVRKESVQKASTGASKASGESRGKRTYRRSDIRELMQKDPTRYRQLEPEIRQAYQDGRVVGP